MAVSFTDAQIKQDVLDEIRHDVRIQATNIDVEVANGVVRLNGSVPTYFQKITAGSDAQRIKGVRDVVNNLVVSLAAPWSDEEIQNTVRANLARDVRLPNPANLFVQVKNGVVTLAGTVGTYAQKTAAEDDAWTAPGVIDVVDDLAVTPPYTRNDTDVTADIRTALTADPALDAKNIAVSVTNGTAYLRGTVPTYYQVRQAANDAWGIAGVLNVVNELGVAF
ncbi:MAG TPA: BON domain-containing protein [Chloroflexota bacterium]|nr:BON domain-containing protein [Chloroflexota bacterium]